LPHTIVLLFQVDTEEAAERKKRETERDRQFCSYGFKFEQYMSVDSPGSQPDTNVSVDENEEFCCMFRTRIGGHCFPFIQKEQKEEKRCFLFCL
jgi:RAT1-interacting protein